MTEVFDTERPEHEKALRLLETRTIAWITWVGRDGRPHAVPVWFYWHDGRVFVISEPDTAKVAAVRRGSPVLVHLDTGSFGSEVVILNGEAEVSERDASSWLAEFGEPYVEKYAAAIDDYGVALDDLARRFSAVIVFTPQKLLAW